MVNTTVSWANNDAASTEKLIELPGAYKGRLLVVVVRNPSSETALTGQIKQRWVDGNTVRYANFASSSGNSEFTVTSANGDGQAFLVDGGLLPSGGQLSLKNVTLIGAAGAFTAQVQVSPPAGD